MAVARQPRRRQRLLRTPTQPTPPAIRCALRCCERPCRPEPPRGNSRGSAVASTSIHDGGAEPGCGWRSIDFAWHSQQSSSKFEKLRGSARSDDHWRVWTK
eukprot:2961742-Rhodomonas_salina.2